MPRVKIDYIVSFSSEDSEHPASNLLSREVNKKKWLCKKGESSCSVVLQLTKAVKISGVHIGVHHAALVEVLVARSETSTDQFQVLVASSVFVSPSESRRDVPVDRVRSFSCEQLAPDTRHQKWDRVRVVCSQPYNKHCKYGLSFIHIDEAEGSVPTKPSVLHQLMLTAHSSDEEDFKPGELFAKHLQKKNNTDDVQPNTSTGAQIRQATSQALKNLPDSSTKLTKTPIHKLTATRDNFTSDTKLDRTRDTLLYNDDDEKPHAKIDDIINKHKNEKDKNAMKIDKKESKERNIEAKRSKDVEKKRDDSSVSQKRKNDSSASESSREHEKRDDTRKRRRSHTEEGDAGGGESGVLRGCVLVLSGYTHPRRARVRLAALALGARVRPDWGADATHLVCAFPNTPKLREVRKSRGDSVPVVLAEWVEECSRQRKLLPWRQFATEPKHRRNPPPPGKQTRTTHTDRDVKVTPTPPKTNDSDTECDTDDEIEKVLQKQKKRRTVVSDECNDTDTTHKMDVDNTTESEDERCTDVEESERQEVKKFGGALPEFFEGHTFVVDAASPDAEQLTRYVKAYGGVVVDPADAEDEVEYVIVGGGATHTIRARHVLSAAWLARCHTHKMLLPVAS